MNNNDKTNNTLSSEEATSDLRDMKSNKKAVKIRLDSLFCDFLDCRTLHSEKWTALYTSNPILSQIASVLVWRQSKDTFILTPEGTVRSDGTPYEIKSSVNIGVAHPMKMMPEEVLKWQEYLTENRIKQPFVQMWEPVINPETVRKDRYSGCRIPYYMFLNREKHGITVGTRSRFDSEPDISFADCRVGIKTEESSKTLSFSESNYDIYSFEFDSYTRYVNHIVAYLDKVTVFEKIVREDTSIANILYEFTPDMINNLIEFAVQTDSVLSTAVLMEYKNKKCPDYGITDKFTLDF